MKDIRKGNCPLCDHDQILEGQPAEFSTDFNKELPMAFAYGVRPKSWMLDERREADQAIGLLQYYMCRACGFVQWFVQSPEQVPIGDGYRTRLIQGVPARAPFR